MARQSVWVARLRTRRTYTHGRSFIFHHHHPLFRQDVQSPKSLCIKQLKRFQDSKQGKDSKASSESKAAKTSKLANSVPQMPMTLLRTIAVQCIFLLLLCSELHLIIFTELYYYFTRKCTKSSLKMSCSTQMNPSTIQSFPGLSFATLTPLVCSPSLALSSCSTCGLTLLVCSPSHDFLLSCTHNFSLSCTHNFSLF
jgi:hypothetical protein